MVWAKLHFIYILPDNYKDLLFLHYIYFNDKKVLVELTSLTCIILELLLYLFKILSLPACEIQSQAYNFKFQIVFLKKYLHNL